jgi:YVTN family beta-propeller protein
MTKHLGAARTLSLAILAGAALALLAAAPARSSSIVPNVIADVTIGKGAVPNAIAINTKTNRVYVANLFASTISVIDGDSDKIIATIPVTDKAPSNGYSNGPGGLAVDEATNTLYVGMNNGAIAIVDCKANRQTSSFTLNLAAPVFSNNMAYNDKTGLLYYQASQYPDILASEITVIDPKAHKVLDHILDPDSSQVAVDRITNKIYVTQYWEGTLWVIDGKTNQLTDIINGTGLRAEPEGCWLVSPPGEYCTISQGSNEDGVAVDETLHRAYVFNSLGGLVATVNTAHNKTIKTRTIDDNQFTGALNPANHGVYTIADQHPLLAVIDGSTDTLVASNIRVGKGTTYGSDVSTAVAVNPVTGKIYVADAGNVSQWPNGLGHVVVLKAQ